MRETNTIGGGRRPLSLLLWAVLAAALAGGAYLAGAGLARWMSPSLALPLIAPAPSPLPTQSATNVAVTWLSPGQPVDGTLESEDSVNEWRFRGDAGQSVTVETWLHPGSGSSVDAELALQLLASDGTILAEEAGSVFLTPYLFVLQLPGDALYSIRVAPTSGAPGRYSLLLTLAEASAPGLPGTSLAPRPTAASSHAFVVTAAPGMFQWPTPNRRISGWIFHDPGNPGHIGLDIAADTWDPIVAAAGGVVVFAEWGGGYGNLVIVEHPEGWVTYYAHLTEIVVKVGQEVQQGDLLGGAGTTGYSTGTHLHFEIRYRGRPVDPQIYLQ